MIRFTGLSFGSDFKKRSVSLFENAQSRVDKKCIDLMEDYVPIAMPRFKNHGKMSRSHIVEKPGVIINTEPKARNEYYTNKGSSGGKHGKLWFDRMKADHRSDILKELK